MPVPTSTDSSDFVPPLLRARKKAGKASSKHAVNSTHVDVNSQLLDAVRGEKSRVVRRLLDSKADPNTCTPQNETALMRACSIRDEESRTIILRLLLHKGADVNVQDSSGQTALMRAVLLDDADTISVLLGKNSDISLEDCNGNNALCHAASRGDEEIVRRIVQEFKARKLDIDKKNMRGLTPLLIACKEGHIESARVLVKEGGASPSIRDLDNFMTAQEWMKRSGSCSSPEIDFLSPVSRKRSYYRKQRQMRGIKTLSDLPLPVNPPENDRVVAPKAFTTASKYPRRTKRSLFPQISELAADPLASSFRDTASEYGTSSTGAKSMFDLPRSSKQSIPVLTLGRKPVPTRRVSKPEIPFTTVKADLYHSPYLTKRQLFLSSGHRSGCQQKGTLEPLDFNPQEKLRRLEAEEKSRRDDVVRHNALPPIKRQTTYTKMA